MFPVQWRIQDLRLGGAHFLGIRFAPPPPLRGFPEATIKVYTWIFFSRHNKSLYLDFLGFRIAPPLVVFFSEATIKVYTWIFLDFDLHPPPLVFFSLKPLYKCIPGFIFWSHYTSLYLSFLKGGPGPPAPPWIRPCCHKRINIRPRQNISILHPVICHPFMICMTCLCAVIQCRSPSIEGVNK